MISSIIFSITSIVIFFSNPLSRLLQNESNDGLKVVFKNLKSGECEYISNVKKGKKLKPIKIISEKRGKKLLKKKIAGITNEGNNYKIKKDVREKMLSNMPKLIKLWYTYG